MVTEKRSIILVPLSILLASIKRRAVDLLNLLTINPNIPIKNNPREVMITATDEL